MRPGGERGSLLGLAAIVVVCSTLLAVGTSRVHEWIVMTDELLYVKLARHAGVTGSPIPTLHGEHVGFLGMVYPLVLSPFYATLDAPEAFRVAHSVNAVLFASAAIPAYLLARRLLRSGPALAVALLSVALPWCIQAAVVMSEAAAYPVFLWTVLALHLAVSEPSPRRDALAAGALALAFFTRPQFLVLALVLPLAVVVVDGPRGAVRRHRLLAGAYAAGVLVVVPLAALGRSATLLGDYGVTATKGSVLPAIAWKSAAIHLDVLAIGIGVVPLLLGAGWAYSRLRDPAPRRRGFAALTALSVPLLALETASFDVRFGGAGVIRDRYLFYLAPLLLLAGALCLAEPRLPVAGIAGTTAFFAATVAFAALPAVPGVWLDSPESVLNGVIRSESAGLPPGAFVALCGVLLGVICLLAARLPRAAVSVVLAAAVFSFSASAAGYAFHRLLASTTPGGIPVTGSPRVRDWIDRVVPARERVALVAYPVSRDWGQSAILWWDTELWNDRARRAFVAADGTFTYTPFPTERLRPDPATGVFRGTEHAPAYVLMAGNDSRFGLAATRAATNYGLDLLVTPRPYRASWMSEGLEPDGWTRPDRPATIRVFGNGRLTVAVHVDAPPEATSATTFSVGGKTGSVDPGAGTAVTLSVCARAGHVDLALRSRRSATIAGPPLGPQPGPPRAVGVVLSGVSAEPARTPCS